MAVRMLDIDPGVAPEAAVVAELGGMAPATDGVVPEVAIAPGRRRVLRGWRRRGAAGGWNSVRTSLVLVTGGGRGVTAPLCAGARPANQRAHRADGAARRTTRRNRPGPRASRRRNCARRRGAWLREAGQSATPREIEALCTRVLALRDLRAKSRSAAGQAAPVAYVSADLSDSEAGSAGCSRHHG
ncbi:MAG: hypothetical protein WDN49_18705 [Acetobacteraceae bacterium]